MVTFILEWADDNNWLSKPTVLINKAGYASETSTAKIPLTSLRLLTE